ncbi:RNA polymerase sigma factor [Caldalkalibacillus uzonensis]|uniref:RNA polymerase sigma factor SigI n=1 Tax=Caldalkalibacillus uzonensis TaxID=353224 RepID=A0ABU0CU13_9BACI|nr:RNA polymerase sigma-I factor [Caldalkalibacillus uzonensis]MDQ0339909.1 RNA polymerase sigma factor [Caldalkalibacillus uzonensis]
MTEMRPVVGCRIQERRSMNAIDLQTSITAAQRGDDTVRETLIRRYQPFILNTVGHICQRYVTWNDEEASIGLLAFNRAIETYQPSAGRTFLNYAYLLIKRDLIDYYRRENKKQHIPFDRDTEYDAEEPLYLKEHAVQSYHQDLQSAELVEEIIEFEHQLARFNIAFEELERVAPQHRDTRERLFQMADDFVRDEELVRHLFEKKRLPVSLFTKRTGYHPRTIERHRKYLITLIVLKSNPQWVHLSQFINRPAGNGGSS